MEKTASHIAAFEQAKHAIEDMSSNLTVGTGVNKYVGQLYNGYYIYDYSRIMADYSSLINDHESNSKDSEISLLEALTHEIRTPLATIRTLIRSLLRKQDLSKVVEKRLKQIDIECTEQIDRFGLIFNAVELERSKPEQVNLAPMRAKLALQQVLLMFEPGVVVAHSPTYASTTDSARTDAGHEVVSVPVQNNRFFGLFDEVKAQALAPENEGKPIILLLLDPHNPSAIGMTKEEEDVLAKLVQDHPNVNVVHDFAYQGYHRGARDYAKVWRDEGMPHASQTYIGILSTSKSVFASGQPAIYTADKNSMPFIEDHYQRMGTGPTSTFVHDLEYYFDTLDGSYMPAVEDNLQRPLMDFVDANMDRWGVKYLMRPDGPPFITLDIKDKLTTAVMVDESPLVSVSQVQERQSQSDAYVTLITENSDSSGKYEYIVDTELDLVRRTTATGDKAFPMGVKAVKVVYRSGYASTPDDLKLACFDLVKYYLKDERKSGMTIAGATVRNDVSTSLRENIGFPDHIKRILDFYKVYK